MKKQQKSHPEKTQKKHGENNQKEHPLKNTKNQAPKKQKKKRMGKIRHRQLRAAYPPELVAADLTFSITLPSRRHLNLFLSNLRLFNFGGKIKKIAWEKIKKHHAKKTKYLTLEKKQKIRG